MLSIMHTCSCKNHNVGPKDFHLELVHFLLKEVGLRKRMQHSSGGLDRAQSECVTWRECLRYIGLNAC